MTESIFPWIILQVSRKKSFIRMRIMLKASRKSYLPIELQKKLLLLKKKKIWILERKLKPQIIPSRKKRSMRILPRVR